MGIEVLGPVSLRTEEGAQVEVPERKVRLLLAALVAAGGEAVPADALIERAWGDRLPVHPERVLRAKLSVLRTALDQVAPGMRERLRHGPGGYTLTVEDGMIDAHRFTAEVTRAQRLSSPADRADALDRALSLWRGAAYADVADELWLAPVITVLDEKRSSAIEIRAESLLEAGDPAAALDLVRDEISERPGRERLVAAQMHALYQLGRQDESLRAYELLRHRLVDELGADPTPALRELHARILHQDPTLALPDNQVRTPKRGNLPAATTPLIGRIEETEHVTSLLTTHRLLTLTGAGGVGKTRLALHTAQVLAERFERGVWLIDLTQLGAHDSTEELADGRRVAQLVVDTLGVPDDGRTESCTERLGRALGEQTALLVLDNAEHVIAEAAAFAADLLARAPGVRMLSTSRQAFALLEEQRFDVTTLSTVAEGGPSEAARFFMVRAQATDPHFDPNLAGLAAIETLCRRLDGLPLALELAAGRVRGLSVADLVERLTDRLGLLTRPGHGVPRRQQTLRGMIDWSWSLLDERERAVLRRLAVHPGPWSLSAIEAICADEPDGVGDVTPSRTMVPASEVVDELIGLVDRSMVATADSPAGGLQYRLLESIGLYAAERLAEAGERDLIAHRHLVYFRDVARDEDARLRGAEQQDALERFGVETHHIDHAFAEALRRGDGGNAVAIILAVFWYRYITGRRAWLGEELTAAIELPGPRGSAYAAAKTLAVCETMLEHARPDSAIASALDEFDDDEIERARIQWFAGASLMATGLRSGEVLIDSALDALRSHGDEWSVLAAVAHRDWFLVSQWAESPRGLPGGGVLVDATRARDDRFLEAQALQISQIAAENAAEHEQASVWAERALEICTELGFWSDAAWCAASTAIGAIRHGDTALARQRVQLARQLAAEVGDPFVRAYVDFPEAMIARASGDVDRARAILEGWFGNAHGLRGDPGAQIEHAYLCIETGELDAAGEVASRLLPLITGGDRPRLTARWLELGAAVRCARGDHESAAWLLGVSDCHRDQQGSPRDSIEETDVTRLWRHLRTHHGEADLADRYRAGQREHPEAAFAMVT